VDFEESIIWLYQKDILDKQGKASCQVLRNTKVFMSHTLDGCKIHMTKVDVPMVELVLNGC